MNNKMTGLILLASLFITNLFGCGSGGSNASLDVSINSSGAHLESISITPTDPAMHVDTDIQFTATGIYSDNTTQDLTATVTWTSSAVESLNVASGTEVAQFTGFSAPTIDRSSSSSILSPGHTKATSPGKAKITASSGSISGSTTVTVTSATLLSLAITPTNPSIVNGTSQQFVATGTFSDNTTQDLTITVTWSSSDAAVASISNAAGSIGLAASVAPGSTTITAAWGGVSGTAALTVTGAGVVTLAWDAPTTNTDGSSLNPATDLSLYKIYYGTAPLMYSQIVDVANPGTNSISAALNLSSGTYYFTVTTVNIFGQESSYSNQIMKTI